MVFSTPTPSGNALQESLPENLPEMPSFRFRDGSHAPIWITFPVEKCHPSLGGRGLQASSGHEEFFLYKRMKVQLSQWADGPNYPWAPHPHPAPQLQKLQSPFSQPRVFISTLHNLLSSSLFGFGSGDRKAGKTNIKGLDYFDRSLGSL